MLSRRKLLKDAVWLSVFAGTSMQGFASPASTKKIFNIGACDWSLGKNSDIAAFDIAKQIGLDGIMVNMGSLDNNMHLRQKELQQPRHHQREQKPAQGCRAGGRGEILALEKDEQRHRQDRHHGVNQPARPEETKPVRQVVDGLEQKLADVAVLDVGGDLPVVFIHRRQRIDNRDQQVIGNHLRQRVTGDAAARRLAVVDGAPEQDGGGQRHQPECRAEQEVHAIDEHVLNADVDDVPVFFHGVGGRISARMPHCCKPGPVCKRKLPDSPDRRSKTKVVGIASYRSHESDLQKPAASSLLSCRSELPGVWSSHKLPLHQIHHCRADARRYRHAHRGRRRFHLWSLAPESRSRSQSQGERGGPQGVHGTCRQGRGRRRQCSIQPGRMLCCWSRCDSGRGGSSKVVPPGHREAPP